MATTVEFEVSFGQIALFASALQEPFNDWTDVHVSQGFAWRPGSVSFLSLAEDGRHSIEIDVANQVGALHHDAVRVIEVPFEVPPDGGIEVGSIADLVPVSLPAGSFLLRCEFLKPGEANARVRLTFAKNDAPHFSIVLADQGLSVSGDLLKTAQPATY